MLWVRINDECWCRKLPGQWSSISKSFKFIQLEIGRRLWDVMQARIDKCKVWRKCLSSMRFRYLYALKAKFAYISLIHRLQSAASNKTLFKKNWFGMKILMRKYWLVNFFENCQFWVVDFIILIRKCYSGKCRCLQAN